MGEGKRESSSPPKGKRESSAPHKEKREIGGNNFCDPIALGKQTARTHASTHARTTRHETISPVDSPPQPPINELIMQLIGRTCRTHMENRRTSPSWGPPGPTIRATEIGLEVHSQCATQHTMNQSRQHGWSQIGSE